MCQQWTDWTEAWKLPPNTAQNEVACGSSSSPPRRLSVFCFCRPECLGLPRCSEQWAALDDSGRSKSLEILSAARSHQVSSRRSAGSSWVEVLRVRDERLTENQLIKKQLDSSYVHLQAHTGLWTNDSDLGEDTNREKQLTWKLASPPLIIMQPNNNR